MHIADRCAPWKRANGAENLVLQALQFQYVGFCRKFPETLLNQAVGLLNSQHSALNGWILTSE
jgi:hypothetical protein